jgi:hypothetical protein
VQSVPDDARFIAWLYGGPYDGQRRTVQGVVEKLYFPDEQPMRFTLAEGTTMLRHVYRRTTRPALGEVIFEYEGMST